MGLPGEGTGPRKTAGQRTQADSLGGGDFRVKQDSRGKIRQLAGHVQLELRELGII